MAKHFTKYEAAALLGEIVECKETYKRRMPGFEELEDKTGHEHMEFITECERGYRARVVSVDYPEEAKGIYVTLLCDDDYVPVRKEEFEHHFSVLVPVDLTSMPGVRAPVVVGDLLAQPLSS